mmetsp:Transcript_68289/g.142736  ORF Transcript_68289/g.142736 Transcript_68289/m.142736 type:complete len:212 (-) Transcript_68289:695-1330(-)
MSRQDRHSILLGHFSCRDLEHRIHTWSHELIRVELDPDARLGQQHCPQLVEIERAPGIRRHRLRMKQDQPWKSLPIPRFWCCHTKVKHDDWLVREFVNGLHQRLCHSCMLPIWWTSIVVDESFVHPTSLAHKLVPNSLEPGVYPRIHETLKHVHGKCSSASWNCVPRWITIGTCGLPHDFPFLTLLASSPLQTLTRRRFLGSACRIESRVQ